MIKFGVEIVEKDPTIVLLENLTNKVAGLKEMLTKVVEQLEKIQHP